MKLTNSQLTHIFEILRLLGSLAVAIHIYLPSQNFFVNFTASHLLHVPVGKHGVNVLWKMFRKLEFS